jgi:hypothetical protein
MISLILNFLILISTNPISPMENLCGTMSPRYGDKDWGDGCFRIPTNFYATVYSDTSGTVYGMLRPHYSFVMLYDREDHEVKLSGVETESIGDYDTVFMKMKKSSNANYVMISWKNGESRLFLSKAELDNYKTEYYRYLDLICKDAPALKNISSSQMGINLPMSCLNLRKGPSIDFPVIASIPGNDISREGEIHINILDSKGEWVKVEVIAEVVNPAHSNEEMEDGPCPDIVISNRTGWMKAVDKNGYPNLWYAYPGY